MSRHRSFVRKIAYLVAIVLLALMLSWVGRPATSDVEGAAGSHGGPLAKLRAKEKLEQAQLGKIDPTGETIKLATLGMRGIAANILWTKANDYKMKKDWTNLSATTNQIIRLQPNFITVWQFQGWNLAYNCSAEFDDYRQRYQWVIKGINFLKEGIRYNEDEPRLLRDIGRFISEKIGRADEHVQFRRLFKEDDEFHQAVAKEQRDNWYVGKKWYLVAENVADTHQYVRLGTSPLLFRAEAPKCQMYYADALEGDGVFGEKAKTEWKRAGREWEAYGKLDIPTVENQTVRLGEVDRLRKRIDDLVKELDALVPGAREKLFKDNLARLSDEHRKARATRESDRTLEQHQLVAEADELTRVSADRVAGQATGANRAPANRLLERIKELVELTRATESARGVVNYGYWKLRAEVEQTDEMRDARQYIYEADKSLAQGDLPAASENYNRGILAWATVLRRFPQLVTDKSTIDDIDEVLKNYGKTLDQRDELFPEDFVLADFVRAQVESNDKYVSIPAIQEKAEKALADGDLVTARRNFEETLALWRFVTGDIPSLDQRSDRATSEEIFALTRQYAKVLKALKTPFPDDFFLRQFVWNHVEHDRATRAARAAIEQGSRLLEKKELAEARRVFDQGLSLWRGVLDKYPSVIADKAIDGELMAAISDYRRLLDQQKQKLPDKFVLQDVLDHHGKK
jgi:hypothetical protein